MSELGELWKHEIVVVPEGKFLYGENKIEAHLPEYQIGKYPVTNEQYLLFVTEIDRTWVSPVGRKPEYASHPATYVTWHDAVAYCRWLDEVLFVEGYTAERNCVRLPTEQEWEKAARGVDGREFPWGDEWDETRCNTSESGIDGTTPVGKYSPAGDSPYGCCDMAGNVWEWTASDRDDTFVRGGSWRDGQSFARCAMRGRNLPVDWPWGYGFRCVVVPIPVLGDTQHSVLCPHCGKEIELVAR